MSETAPITTTGRRKTAIARIRMQPGEGKITVNGRSMEDYFPTITQQNGVLQPFHITNQSQMWDVVVRAEGGGIPGQVGAVRLGIARALIKHDPELRPSLKKEGLLTRDARMKERKKSGQPGARKRFQFSKR